MNQHELSDLPEELVAELRKPKGYCPDAPIIELFEPGEQMTINDVLIAYWKRHGKVLKRGTVASTLARCANSGKGIRRCGKGVYTARGNQHEQF